MDIKNIFEKLKMLSPDQKEIFLKRIKKESQDNNIPDANREKPIAASLAQRALWLTHELEGGSQKYNMVSAYFLEGELHLNEMINAFDVIVRRHESLRTKFFAIEGEPFQEILESSSFKVDFEDLTNHPDIDGINFISKIIADFSAYVFDINSEILTKIKIVKLTEKKHILLMNFHHIIFDGYSKGLLLQELGKIYSHTVNNSQGNNKYTVEQILGSLKIQYCDYSEWQHKKATIDEQLGFWREQLKNCPSVINLPADRLRAPLQQDKGKMQKLVFGMELSNSIQQLAKNCQTTVFNVVLAAFSLLLHKVSGDDDILIGTPVERRPHEDLQNVIGYFLNTTVLRLKIQDGCTFKSHLQSVVNVTQSAFSNQDVPWDELVKAISPMRSQSYAPLFQVMMVFQNAKSHEFELPGLHVKKISGGNNSTKYDLYSTFVEKDQGLEGWFTYNAQLFDESTIESMVSTFKGLLTEICEYPDHLLNSFEWLGGSAEPSALSGEVLDIDAQKNNSVSLIQEAAKKNPTAIAIYEHDQHISFEQLENASNALAQEIKALKINSSIVGIHLPRSSAFIVSMLAIFKAGMKYIPLDPTLPKERLNFIISDSAPEIIITNNQKNDLLIASESISYLNVADDFCYKNFGNIPYTARSDLLSDAYVLYTSGSTGTPKGVVGTHLGLTNRILWMANQFPVGAGELFVHKTNSSFVDSVAEILFPLSQGAPLVILPDDCASDLALFMKNLAKYSVTRLVIVPSLLKAILDLYSNAGQRLPALRKVFCSGEELTTQLAVAFYKAFPNAELINLYGSTEVAADVLCYRVPASICKDNKIALGEPISNTEIYILDEHCKQIAKGLKGDIYVSGFGLASGYLGNPSIKNSAFISEQESGIGKRLYKMGDRGCINQTNQIEYLGRTDRQVKFNGIRIALDEIEASLEGHPAINAAISRKISHGDSESALVVYYQLKDDSEVTVQDLREYLMRVLPSYMVPGYFIEIDEIPLNNSGKTDVNALPDIEFTEHDANDYVMPQTDTEHRLASIWLQHLPVSKVGIHESFFQIGGHSLLAAKIAAKIAAEFSIEMSVKEIFELLTIHKLARYVDDCVSIINMDFEKITNIKEDDIKRINVEI